MPHRPARATLWGMRHETLFVALFSVLPFFGCGSDGVTVVPNPIADAGDETDSSETAPIDTGTSDVVTPPDDTGPSACNTLVNGGSTIDETVVDAAAPTLAGGTIAPGTYVLTKYELFKPGGPAGTTGNTLKQTMQITATTLANVTSNNRGPDRRLASTYTSPTKTTLYVVDTCGSTDKYFFGYESTPTTLKFGAGTSSAYYVLTFDKK